MVQPHMVRHKVEHEADTMFIQLFPELTQTAVAAELRANHVGGNGVRRSLNVLLGELGQSRPIMWIKLMGPQRFRPRQWTARPDPHQPYVGESETPPGFKLALRNIRQR